MLIIRGMKKTFLIIGMLLSFPAFAKVEVHFTPSKACEESIIDLINNSNKTIDAAVYSINNTHIVSALKKAHNRGVRLRILTDKLQASSKSSKVLDLYEFGINIKVNSKFKIEHNKFAIFDHSSVSTGSFNWTNPASAKNSENCVFLIKDKHTVNAYQQRFENLWLINSKTKSDNWFERKLYQRQNL